MLYNPNVACCKSRVAAEVAAAAAVAAEQAAAVAAEAQTIARCTSMAAEAAAEAAAKAATAIEYAYAVEVAAKEETVSDYAQASRLYVHKLKSEWGCGFKTHHPEFSNGPPYFSELVDIFKLSSFLLAHLVDHQLSSLIIWPVPALIACHLGR